MASTYSDLKIELIGTGEQSGTWGTTTNNNLGNAALGEAITGSADVAFSSADVTVTLTDTNASQTARNLRLNLTGTSGGARQLILGSGCQIEKLYLINNGLADAVTVKNTSGTGIAVPAGKSMFVFNNGTNVVDAVTYVAGLATSGANSDITSLSGLTTPLSVAQGGTGASTDAGTAYALKGANSDITSITGLTTPLTVAQGGTGAASLRAATIATLGYTTTATAAGTTTLTATSTATQFFTGSTTQTVVLPVASTMTQGQQFTIHNNSSDVLTINSSGANLVATVNANTTATITCILTSGTDAASWDADFTGFTTALPVARGGTGVVSTTAYGVLAGGTTTTGALQNIGTGTTGQVLVSNGAAALPTFQSFSAGLSGLKSQAFTSPGTWTVPSGVTQAKVTVIGGGGGGGGNTIGYGGIQGGIGGAGGININYVTGLTPGGTVSVTVGAAGNPAGSGGTSTFGPGGSPATTITATGGGGGNNGGPGTGNPGSGGSGGGYGFVVSGASTFLGVSSGANYFLYGHRGGIQDTVGLVGGGGGRNAAPPNGGSGAAGGAGLVLIEF